MIDTDNVIFVVNVCVIFVQVSRIAESLHVLHLQSSLHKQLDGNPRVSDRSWNCSRVANGGQLSWLLENRCRVAGAEGTDIIRMCVYCLGRPCTAVLQVLHRDS